MVGALWALDPALAHQRQFPAVDWETSYSLSAAALRDWFRASAGEDWESLRADLLGLLQRDRELREIAGLIGPEALQDADRLVLEVAAAVRANVLGQSAFDPNDAFSPIEKTRALARGAVRLGRAARAALDRGAGFEQLQLGPAARALAALRRAAPAELAAPEAALDAALRALAPAGAA